MNLKPQNFFRQLKKLKIIVLIFVMIVVMILVMILFSLFFTMKMKIIAKIIVMIFVMILDDFENSGKKLVTRQNAKKKNQSRVKKLLSSHRGKLDSGTAGGESQPWGLAS